ncbi:sensor histidine kinase [Actinophytocola oryzae]|uniref:histidine kinase n=1 Tax=Actinophytocola oryzae TaxID=502181 RepID=A0A4R7W6H0_9PSEU|nr:histidine kinase [Actinophytocola oryzae]TDV57758.1 signal transduction histidine kinase [Actinophytocola oryzae]
MLADTASPRVVVRRWSAPVLDGVLAAVVTVSAFVPTLTHVGPEIGDLPAQPVGAGVGLALTLAMSVPLALRSRWPAVCLLTVGGAFAVDQVLGHPETFAKVGFLLSLYAAGAHAARSRHVLGAVMTAGYAVLAVVLQDLGSAQRLPDFVAFYLIMVVIWLCGTGMRRWRAESAERARLAAEVATAAERARIARELHDVVTHHVTAMVVQADAAQYLLDSTPERVGDGLTAISDTGRQALAELRALLGVLGEATTAERTPTMGRVGDLVEQARLSGQPVEWREQGAGRPRSVDAELAAYRVVQESLTNAIKHATGRPTTVLVRHAEEHIEIEVNTEGPVVAPPVTPSGGRGLAGLRERVRMLDGDLVTASRPDGGFRVRALIPAGDDRGTSAG